MHLKIELSTLQEIFSSNKDEFSKLKNEKEATEQKLKKELSILEKQILQVRVSYFSVKDNRYQW